ncbi:M56 family metallopeptidase [Flavobacterium sp.]
MIHFLITSTVCLLVFLAFYHLVLEREKTHCFNRFYLLLTIVISLLIPFITYEIIEIVPAQSNEQMLIPEFTSEQTVQIVEKVNYIPFILWSLYGATTLLLLIRFGKNIWKLNHKAKSNPSVIHQYATLVLVEEKTLPHSFLNFIYVNFEEYNNRAIEDELYTHELVHVNQKHTFDILFVELLKTIFWFNPVFYFYKKAIQLNHEFLADEKVVNSYNDVPFYQNLLLQKSSNIQTIYLASNLNYLVTKKRLIMMTKKTSKSLAIVKKIAIVPILSGLIYFLCVEVVAQEQNNPISVKQQNKIEQNSTVSDNGIVLEKEYFKGVRFKYYTDSYKDKNGKRIGNLIIDKTYEELTEVDKDKINFSLLLIPKAIQKKSPTSKELQDFKDQKKYAIWIDGVNVANSKLDNLNPKEIAYFDGSVILKNARTKKHPQPFQYWFYTHSYFDANEMGKQKTKYDGSEIAVWHELNSKRLVVDNRPKQLVKLEGNPSAQDSIYNSTNLDKSPEYSGGMQAFYKFVGENFTISDEGIKDKIKGKVFVKFIIEKDGSLSNFTILRDFGYGTGEETVRVLKLSPKWKPGEIKGKPVRVQYSLPITVSAN